MSKDQKLIDGVIARAQRADGTRKLACAEAFELARQFQVKIIEIGRICNQNNIKISKCQLGCFP